MELNNLIIQTIGSVIEELNEDLPGERKLPSDQDSILFGNGGVLDSLELVHFIIAVEQAIEERFQISLVLADEKAMSLRGSPFRTIRTLSDYIASLLEAQ